MLRGSAETRCSRHSLSFKVRLGTSPGSQGLSLHASSAGGPGLIPSQGSSTSHVARKIKKYDCPGTSLLIQWFRTWCCHCWGQGLIPGWGTIPRATWWTKKKKKKKEYSCPPYTGQLRQAAKKGQVGPGHTGGWNSSVALPSHILPAARVWGESAGKEPGATSLFSPPPMPGAGGLQGRVGKSPPGFCPRAVTA